MPLALRAALAAGLALLAGCEKEAFCNGFGSGATFTWSCTNCTVASQGLAGDEDLDTAASFAPTAGATSDTAVLTAKSASTIAGGATVGVFVTRPSTLGSTDQGFRTLLAGAVQEASDAGNFVEESTRRGTDAETFLGMRTTQEFDTVEFTSTNTWGSGEAPVYLVYEACSDGGNE